MLPLSKFKTSFLFVTWTSVLLFFLYIASSGLSYVWRKKTLPSMEASSMSELVQTKKTFQRTLTDFKKSSALSSELNADVVLVNSKNRAKKTIKMQLNEALKKAQEKEYNIIIWNPLIRKASLQINSNQCGKCNISYDRSKVNDTSTKAMIFHYKDLEAASLPFHRKDQHFVWWTLEAPPTLLYLRNLSLTQFDGLFNLTMTYRRDSDVYSGYSNAGAVWRMFHKSSSVETTKDIRDTISNKSKLALWVVSNCRSTIGTKKRIAYSYRLVAAGLSLDRFGACFRKNGQIASMDIAKMYMFYLAFENSLNCKDYITEKVFINALAMGTVPVVMGASKSDYEAVVPPGSCIYVEDFKTPKDLVRYLNYLNKNITAYKEYFKWRTMSIEDMPQYNRTNSFCNLCRILHGINVDNMYKPNYVNNQENIPLFGYPSHPRVVYSLQQWYYSMENQECLARN